MKERNIIYVLVDDMGWIDSSVYGSAYFETPNIDRFASQGMLFTDAHSANPLCFPIRASIMTGKNPDRLGITVPWCHGLPVEASIPESGPSWQKMLTPRPRTYLPQGDAFSGPNSQNSTHVSGTYVRKGPWKLIRRYDSNIHFPNRYELFNLDDDLGETTNLAFEHPDKVKEMSSLMDNYLEDTEALLPIPNPAFEPGTRRWVGLDSNASNELL